MKTYPKEERNCAVPFCAGQENLLASRSLILRVSIIHALEDRAVEHNAEGTVSTHDHATGLLPTNIPSINLESANAPFLPLATSEREKFGLAYKNCLFFFFTGFNCEDVLAILNVKLRGAE